MKMGTQIIYVPNHANGDISHPDCEPGFVEFDEGERLLCRFWRKPELRELRTLANGEWAKPRNIIVKDSVPQEQVEQAIELIVERLQYLERKQYRVTQRTRTEFTMTKSGLWLSNLVIEPIIVLLEPPKPPNIINKEDTDDPTNQ